jgi:heme exporter protein A
MIDSPAPGVIHTDGLSKKYASFPALSGVDLRVQEGESVVIFGPNGAGKTTLVRVLTLGLKPSGGSFRIAGFDPHEQDLEIRRSIGLISHQSFLYDDLSARQNLEFFAALYGIEDPAGRSDRLLEEVGLSHRAEDAVRTFSRGMTQRLSLARALVHDPRIVFLDEPFAGLDPHAARMLRATLTRLREDGRTVLLVTHDLSQGLELSDRWVILTRGRVIAEGVSAGTDRARFESDYFERVSGTRRDAAR